MKYRVIVEREDGVRNDVELDEPTAEQCQSLVKPLLYSVRHFEELTKPKQ